MSLDELRALEQAATPAPWEIAERGWPDAPYVIRGGEGFMENVKANALFVVAARNALPDLLGRVEAAEAERDALRAFVNGLARASLLDIRRAAFAPEIGVRYTEAIRADIAGACFRLEDACNAVLAASVPSGPAAGGDT